MKESIDIFSKLLIATITFTVPVIINLLSTFTAGEKRRLELAKDSMDEISKKATEQLQNDPGIFKEIVAQTNRDINTIDRRTKTELNKLNPIIQFWNIFTCLAISIISLVLYYISKNNKWEIIKSISIFASLIAYVIALIFIIRILYTIINTKRIIEKTE